MSGAYAGVLDPSDPLRWLLTELLDRYYGIAPARPIFDVHRLGSRNGSGIGRCWRLLGLVSRGGIGGSLGPSSCPFYVRATAPVSWGRISAPAGRPG
jgi:hypothetical protein